MQLSQLQLLQYTFDGISVMPVQGYVPDEQFSPELVYFPGKLAMSADTELQQLNEEKSYSDYSITLTLRVGPNVKLQAPYAIAVSVRGVVRMHLTLEANQAEERRVRAMVNGVSLLYGVVREMVNTITSRSVHGLLLLPSMNFSELANQMPEASVPEQVKPKKSSKKPRLASD